ncbi:unnamed protein product [Spirodela intermedia]|uniref:Uncharacterized protein n=1 Tax=Spirodela intermedia TaxID=51605 RepID=A0A7I8LLR5_SPIIN|nr:unnamed protein product [Spirodela intermedia]
MDTWKDKFDFLVLWKENFDIILSVDFAIKAKVRFFFCCNKLIIYR